MNDYKKPAKGQWKNAPLAFVLAQVRFSQQPDGFTEKFQEAIQNLMPHQLMPAVAAPLMQVSIEIGDDGTQKQSMTPIGTLFNLVATDGRMLVRIAPDSLTLAVTSYTDSTDFRNLWMPMVNELNNIDMTGSINRLGLRYVDFVVPQPGESVEVYVASPWNLEGVTSLPGAIEELPGLNFSMMDVGFAKGRMRLQFMRGFGKPNLPADLQGMLEPEAVAMERPDGQSAVIDMDRWIEGQWSVRDDNLQADFSTMQADLSGAFKHMISDYAKSCWNPVAQSC